ncbi:MAG: LysM peptidoglycan-binding domain-containing protein [Bacteroidales bacterium]|nr:LysM peptidoglycan-binding domain-containing protein [Bacteroidales bacterium]
MSDKKLARRVQLKLKFKGVDVPQNINLHLTGATYTDEEEDSTDDFQITYEDRENKLLGKWLEVKPTTSKSTKQVEKKVEDEKTINYVVKRGDTLWAIASKYLGSGTKYPQIAQENNIKNPNLIYPGQVFKITTGGETSSTVKEAGSSEKKKSGGSSSGASPKLVSAVLVQKNWNDTGKDLTLDMGTFEIDSVDMSGPPDKVTVKSTSIPYTSKLRMEKKNKAWEKISLKGIGQEIAGKNGLKLMYEASDNPTYKRKEQVQTSDIKFLQNLCHAAGMALKVTTLTIVIYDAAEYDKKPAVRTFKKGSGDIISYKMGTKLTDTAYTSCHVSYTDPDSKETIEYTYTPDSKTGTGQTLEVNEKVNSKAEAIRLAKKRLREKNTQEYTASLKVVGDVSLVAGITVKLKGFQQFDKKYKVTQAKHNLLDGYTVDLSLKQVLEGY